MQHPTARATLALLAIGLCVSACATQPRVASRTAAPKVILIIGDGMDHQQITMGRNYLVGHAGRLALDGMQAVANVNVQTVDEDRPNVPLYVADSANSATSMATGALTSPGRIATRPGTDEELVTIMELAHAAGLRTGIVTTSSLTDATPASFVAHISDRFCQGPREMQFRMPPLNLPIDCAPDYKRRGGRGSIAEQLADSKIDVLMGGGARHFDQPAEGRAVVTVTDQAMANGYRVIRHREELANTDPSQRLLGIFAAETMAVKLQGAGGAMATRITKVDGKVRLPEPFACEANPAFRNVPTLAEMTRVALRHLDGDRGFMFMIESASIDKQSHARRPCGQIGELAQLDETLTVALEYAKQHPETLILVTADHSQAAQIVTEQGEFLPLGFASPGYYARVLTPEGSVMAVNYATNDSNLQEYHSGAQVALFATGPGADRLPSYLNQADIFRTMTDHLGLKSLPGTEIPK